MHSEWDELSKHEVVSIEQIQNDVKQLVPPKKATLNCALHEGKELELYCETCEELICLRCTIKKHCRPEHKYDLVSDTFEKHKAEITSSLEPVEKLLVSTKNALKQLDVPLQELDDQEAAVEASIRKRIKQLHELLKARQTELIDQLKQMAQTKRKNLETQKDELETIHTRLDNILSFVNDSLRTGSQGEVVKIKKTVTKQIKEVTDNFKPDKLPPCELANINFATLPDGVNAGKEPPVGEVYTQKVSPEKCHVTGKGMEIAKPGERATVVVHGVDHKGKAYPLIPESLTCELVSEITGKKIDVSIKKVKADQFEVCYQPASLGRHHLHIKVEGDHIKGSPFLVTVKLPVKKLGAPIKTIGGLNNPKGVAVNQKGDIIVANSDDNCIWIFNPTGEKKLSFGSQGSGHRQFKHPWGVAVDDDMNLLVTDECNQRIQKFTSDGKFLVAVGKKGTNNLEFDHPLGIAIHPLNKKVYVVDGDNHRLQILNPDLTFSSSFGSRGSDNGQFRDPWDVAFDSTGNVYVSDDLNHRVQVFTAKGEFLRKLTEKNGSNGDLSYPTGIAIDSNNVVYVTSNHRISLFTCEGQFLTSFGTHGSALGQFDTPRGIAVNDSGIVYVSDTGNNRLQLF